MNDQDYRRHVLKLEDRITTLWMFLIIVAITCATLGYLAYQEHKSSYAMEDLFNQCLDHLDKFSQKVNAK